MENSKQEARIQERINYYKAKTERYFRRFSLSFSEFVHNEVITDFGDKLLTKGCSGFNFATDEQFPVNNDHPLIFYSVYAQRTQHFGILLARMEHEQVIKESDVTFGIKGAKIVGDYNDPELVKSSILRDGGINTETRESVEGIMIFHPESLRQVKRIVDFLLEEAPKIEGGYSEPDTRIIATKELKDFYEDSDILKIAFANIYRFREGNIITLTKDKKIEEDNWVNNSDLINKELYGYLTDPKLPIG